MLPFTVLLRPGSPPYEQVIYAVKKALVSGQLLPGDPFPSVRTLSQEIKINPNTAHKVVMALTQEGLLEVKPGVGTIVAKLPHLPKPENLMWLEQAAEQLVVEAKKSSFSLAQITAAVQRQWERLNPEQK